MRTRPAALLARLRALQGEFGGAAAARKRELLRALARRRLASASQVLALHEALCFLCAYPDDAALLEEVEALLARFESRADLRRFRSELEDSGIAGTATYYRFSAPTARWLCRRFGERLSVAWDWLEGEERLEGRLELLAAWAETPGLDEADLPLRRWIERMKGPRETDAAFLVRRFAELAIEPRARDVFYEELGLMLCLAAGPAGPSRTRARLAGAPVHFQTAPLSRARPDLWREIARPPRSVRALSPREGERALDLAREAMVARSRDLDAFAYGDVHDVRLVDFGAGLQFAAIGVRPERRLLLEAVYGFLTLKNGVPIGYVLASALNRSAEIAYNVFDSWRGAESAWIYAQVLAMVAHLFGARSFTVYPYQLGDDNEEGLRSGAWWFYQKLGFRARDRAVLSAMERELERIRRDPARRSSRATLKRLARENVYLERGRRRADVLGAFPLERIGLAATDYLSRRFGSARARGERACAEEARRRLGLGGGLARWSAGEKLAFRRWAPLLGILPGLERWSAKDRLALAAVIRAKGGRRESDFVRRFDAHGPLRRALARLACP